MRTGLALFTVLATLLGSLACRGTPSGEGPGSSATTLQIVSGSENETIEPLVQQFAQREKIKIGFKYEGSLDIMLHLSGSSFPYDAVWPANSIWVALGDKNHLVTNQKSIFRSPVVVGVKRSVAQQLGWINREVKVNDILAAVEAGKLRYMMTSASQSNSGASAYIGYLYAFAGEPDVLTSEQLRDPNVRDKVTRILGKVNRSSGSSGWLKDLFLSHYDDYDAMVNYEAVIIETNQELAKTNREPLYAVYPVDGLAIADSPLGFVSHGDAQKEALFLKLQQYLLSDAVQKQILQSGRRVGPLGVDPGNADKKVFNPDWGIDPSRNISPIKFPPADVMREALDLYQSAFRKASFTVYALDFSGSMAGNGERDLKEAMRTLLDQDRARQNLLQAAPNDVTVVLIFSDRILGEFTVTGNDPNQLLDLSGKISRQTPGGGTNIYAPVVRANEIIRSKGLGDRLPAIILMTDGQSNAGSFKQLRDAGLNDVPVYSILFGDASKDQLQEIATYTSGRIFDGRTSLVDAFRTAKGYN
jgi:Ca-activated chloride channel family protein